MGRVGSKDVVFLKKRKELADRCQFPNPRHSCHALCSQVLHKAFNITSAKAGRAVPIHPVFLHPGKKLVQIIPIGAQGLGGIVLSLQGSEKQLQALCGGHW
jgi:hypothetical protein